MKTYYGFSVANTSAEPAWFHTPEAAQRFAAACGWGEVEVVPKTTTTPDAGSIMDTAGKPWTLISGAGRALGRLGGRSKSPAKLAAARINGRKSKGKKRPGWIVGDQKFTGRNAAQEAKRWVKKHGGVAVRLME